MVVSYVQLVMNHVKLSGLLMNYSQHYQAFGVLNIVWYNNLSKMIYISSLVYPIEVRVSWLQSLKVLDLVFTHVPHTKPISALWEYQFNGFIYGCILVGIMANGGLSNMHLQNWVNNHTNISIVSSSSNTPPNEQDWRWCFTLVNGAKGILNLFIL